MKRLLLIGFLMLFMTALLPVSANADVFVDNDVGIELVQFDDDIIVPLDLSVNLLASCPVAAPLKYPILEQSSDNNFPDLCLQYDYLISTSILNMEFTSDYGNMIIGSDYFKLHFNLKDYTRHNWGELTRLDIGEINDHKNLSPNIKTG